MIIFVTDAVALAQDAARLYLKGLPTNNLADQVAALKVIDLSTARAGLRPPQTQPKS
jgi:hypothetical protein